MAFKKRANGPVIVPGRPDSSALYLVLKMPPKNPKAMPPAGHRVTDREVNLIYDWIKQGKFPPPIKLSPSVSVWRVEDIRAWIEQQGGNV